MSTQPASAITIPILKCMYPGCGNEWVPRTARMPKVCPKCKRYGWETGHVKKRKPRGGKRVDVREATHIGPETDNFLLQIRKKES